MKDCILKIDTDGTLCININTFLQYLYDDDSEKIQTIASILLTRKGIKPAVKETGHYTQTQIDDEIAKFLPENDDLIDHIVFTLIGDLETQMKNKI